MPTSPPPEPVFFTGPEPFDHWLTAHADTATEVWIKTAQLAEQVLEDRYPR